MSRKKTPRESNWAVVRESQSLALALPNTGEAVLLDVGESSDVHPRDKVTPGERLARIALAEHYGKGGVFSGPVFKSSAVEAGKIRVQFEHTEGGLEARTLPATYQPSSSQPATAPLERKRPESQLEGFAICGADKEWKWADARIDGASVVVSSPEVSQPVAVRYGWADNPIVNLYNKAGFPAAPFRTDDFVVITQPVEAH